MIGKLTTHVLDTAHGCPAAGIAVRLSRLGADTCLLHTAVTNADGRCDVPLLEGSAFLPGRYELVFEVVAYFKAWGGGDTGVPFLDDIVIRFGVADGGSHYHVPLLVSPYGYTTYRGS